MGFKLSRSKSQHQTREKSQEETKISGCLDSFGKYLILSTNLVFLLASLGVIGGGTYLEVQMGDYLEFASASMAPMRTSYCLNVIGAVMFIVSFFGCCGAYKENKCMIFTHATFMTLITVVLVGIAVALAVGITDENLKPGIEAKMKELLQNYNKSEHAGVTKTLDFIQENLKCSGVSSYRDWKSTAFGGKGDVPDTCCKKVEPGCGVGIADLDEDEAKNTIYTKGCLDKLVLQIVAYWQFSIGVGVGLVVFLLLAVVVSCCHGNRLGHQSYDSVEQ